MYSLKYKYTIRCKLDLEDFDNVVFTQLKRHVGVGQTSIYKHPKMSTQLKVKMKTTKTWCVVVFAGVAIAGVVIILLIMLQMLIHV